MTSGLPQEVIEYPDTILYDGKVVTVDNEFSVAEAVAVRDGQFLAVGSTNEIHSFAGNDTNMIDLGNRTVIPGLIDSHIHLQQVGMDLARVTLFDARSITDVLDAIGTAADETSDGEWVLGGWGWHESHLEEERLPICDELDQAAPDNPVFVPRGGHVAVLNSMGLDIVGIDADTPDPEGGTIVRDSNTGRPNGVVYENARQQLVEPHLPSRGYDELIADIKRSMEDLNARGVTGAMEPGLERDALRAYQQVHGQEEITVRVDALVRIYEKNDVEEAASYFYRDFGNDLLKIGGVKYMIDGGVEGARLEEPYEVAEGVQEQEDYYGHYILPPNGLEELEETFKLAAERGHQVQTHAVGDAAIETLLDLYEAVNEEISIEDLRWSVMHAFLPTDEHLERINELGIMATVQNHSTYLGQNMQKLWGEERAAYAIPIRKILNAGIPSGGGTDAPVVPWHPFDSIWWMITRGTVTTGTLGPEQGITREEALRLWTQGSAYTMNWEEELGSIEPGKLADLAVLDTDILTCDPDDIRDIDVQLTMVGGDIVYSADSSLRVK